MQSNKYYRNLHNNPFPERKINEELFNTGYTKDGNPGLQQAIHTMLSSLLPQYAIVSGCEVTYDTDFIVNSGYLLIKGDLIEYTGQTFTPTGLGCYVYMTTGGTFFISEDEDYVSNSIPICVNSAEGLIIYYKRGYSVDENMLMDHDPSLFKDFNNIYIEETLSVSGTEYGVQIRNGRIWFENSYIRQSATDVLYTHGSFITNENSIVSGNLNVEGNTVLGDASSDTFTFNPATFETTNDILYIQKTAAAREVHIFTSDGFDAWTPTTGDIVFLCGSWTSSGKTLNNVNITIYGNNLCNIGNIIITSDKITINNCLASSINITGDYCNVSGCNLISSVSSNINCIEIDGSYNRICSNTINISLTIPAGTAAYTIMGIYTDGCNYNIISNNQVFITTVANNGTPSTVTLIGIYLYDSDITTAVGNVIKIIGTADGISVTYGIWLNACAYCNASANCVSVSGADTNTAVSDLSGTGNVVDGTNA
jgi:hypothetical protein